MATEPQGTRTVGWNPAKIRLAETMADSGKLQLAADLCERMFSDDRYGGVMETLASIVGLPLTFEPGIPGADPETDPAVQALGSARGDWWTMLPEQTLGEAIRWLRTLGLCLFHIREWVRNEDTGRIVADIEVWSPRWLELTKDGWVVETSEGKVSITPGDGEWMIWTAFRKNRPWAIAPWRGLARWWLAKALAILDEMDYGEKQGDAKIVAEQLGVEYGLDEPQRLKLVSDLRALGRKGVYAPPPGVTLKLLESSGKTAEVFAAIIRQADTAYAVSQLGGNLSAEVSGGSFAAASVHSQMTADRITSLAQLVSTESHYQLLIMWCEFNLGHRNAPWATYDTTPPEDRQAKAQQLSTTAQAVSSLQSSGLPLDAQRLVEDYGLPVDLDRLEEVRQGQIFQYHLTFGVLTLNEIRERLGLPALPGGDVAPVPIAAPQGEFSARGQASTIGRLNYTRNVIQSKANRTARDVLDEGDRHISELEAQAIESMVDDTRPKVEALVALVKSSGVEEATDQASRTKCLEQLRRKVLDYYGTLEPATYADTMERVEVLAAMTGAWSATSEAG